MRSSWVVMVSHGHVATLAGVAFSFLFGTAALGQGIAANLDSLAAPQLAAEVRRLAAIFPDAPAALGGKLSDQAETLLAAQGIAAADRAMLAQALVPHLRNEVRQSILSEMQPDAAQTASLSFADVQGVVRTMRQLQGGRTDTAAIVSDWLSSHDRSQLTLAQLGWLAAQTTVPAATGDTVSVQWRGSVTAPSDGEYTFSVSPVNASHLRSDFCYAKQSIAVRVGDSEILNSTSEAWRPVGNPVTLAAGEAVPLEIDFSYASAACDRRLYPASVALYWTASGVPLQQVPSSALSPAEGTGPGLSASYRSGQGEIRPQVDADLAFVWTSADSVGSRNTSEVSALVDDLWARATAPEALAGMEGDDAAAAAHPLVSQAYAMAEVLSPERQAEWLNLLQRRPNAVKRLRLKQMADVYAAYRFHAPDDALDTLGIWMQQNAHAGPEFAFRFARENRTPYHQLADMLTRQMPTHAALLQDRYLFADGGACCLPVASTLAFVHLLKGDGTTWRDIVEERLADTGLTPAARVSWLLARAMTEEVRHTSDNPYQAPSVFPLAGEHMLTQALAAANTRPLKEQVYHELISRYASERDFGDEQAGALGWLAQAQKELGGSAKLDLWRSEIERLQQAHQLDQELQVFQRDFQRQQHHQRYLSKAREHSDTRAIQLYQSKLQEGEQAAP